MKGLELARRYYLEYGAPMIRVRFPELEGILAIGLTGAGSECFGYDDETSRDHDFEPGFCIFAPDSLDRKTLFSLERAYATLPRSYLGFERAGTAPVGGSRHGVIMQSDFLRKRTGSPTGTLTPREWMRIPEPYLCEATNGEIFRDDTGDFTAAREALAHMPEPVRLKKLSGNLLLSAQAGPYNYRRSVARGDTASAQLSVIEFARHAMAACFNLAGRYMPYYKWTFRALAELPALGSLADAFEYLISTDNDKKTASVKLDVIDDIVCALAEELSRQSLTANANASPDLERLAYAVNDRITDPDIRNLNILYAVD